MRANSFSILYSFFSLRKEGRHLVPHLHSVGIDSKESPSLSVLYCVVCYLNNILAREPELILCYHIVSL